MEQKIKQVGIDIGGNIRRIRLQKGYGQTELAPVRKYRYDQRITGKN